MSRLFYHTMQDNVGNLLFDVTGTMRIAGSGTLATIYGDEALTAILPNPMTNHPSFGSFKCFLGAGDYDFYMAKAGYTFETLTGVQGHGTMAQQDAGAVAITGGTAILSQAQVTGNVGMGIVPATGTHTLSLFYQRAVGSGIVIQPSADTGGSPAIYFVNNSVAGVGSITTTGSATAYNTSSDGRLKTAPEALTGALDVVRALNPVRFRWKRDDSPGHGFIASEVAQVLEGVVTGEPDAVDATGAIIPQQMDASKLVPWLVAAVKDLTQQVEALTAQLGALAAPGDPVTAPR